MWYVCPSVECCYVESGNGFAIYATCGTAFLPEIVWDYWSAASLRYEPSTHFRLTPHFSSVDFWCERARLLLQYTDAAKEDEVREREKEREIKRKRARERESSRDFEKKSPAL